MQFYGYSASLSNGTSPQYLVMLIQYLRKFNYYVSYKIYMVTHTDPRTVSQNIKYVISNHSGETCIAKISWTC